MAARNPRLQAQGSSRESADPGYCWPPPHFRDPRSDFIPPIRFDQNQSSRTTLSSVRTASIPADSRLPLASSASGRSLNLRIVIRSRSSNSPSKGRGSAGSSGGGGSPGMAGRSLTTGALSTSSTPRPLRAISAFRASLARSVSSIGLRGNLLQLSVHLAGVEGDQPLSLLFGINSRHGGKSYVSSRARAKDFPENKRPASSHEPAGRPVDCLGLTKRWSLYVASHGNSRVWDSSSAPKSRGRKPSRDRRDASIPTHRLVCGL